MEYQKVKRVLHINHSHNNKAQCFRDDTRRDCQSKREPCSTGHAIGQRAGIIIKLEGATLTPTSVVQRIEDRGHHGTARLSHSSSNTRLSVTSARTCVQYLQLDLLLQIYSSKKTICEARNAIILVVMLFYFKTFCCNTNFEKSG